ncbi:hypothetical protein AB7M22_005941 [Pseudomonas sp. ADAK2 TE3594]
MSTTPNLWKVLCRTPAMSMTPNLWERGLPAKASGQATLTFRPSTVVQRSDKITPPNVNTPPTR